MALVVIFLVIAIGALLLYVRLIKP